VSQVPALIHQILMLLTSRLRSSVLVLQTDMILQERKRLGNSLAQEITTQQIFMLRPMPKSGYLEQKINVQNREKMAVQALGNMILSQRKN